jgi:hypothetical protein
MTNENLDRLDVNNPANQQEQKIRLELSIQDLNIVMGALQELPHRVADPVLKKVFSQAQSQLGKPTQQ